MHMSATAEPAIDPASIPQRRLYTGAMMPAIGLGTFGSDSVPAESIAQAVKGAAALGYRHFDCASVYGNEAAVGKALQAVFETGVRREDVWVTSKLWNDMHDPEAVVASCRRSLQDLRLDYLDLYLVHWPFPNFHPPGCDVSSRSPDAKPYIHESFMRTWRAMEALVDEKLVRHIGTSNMTIPKLSMVLRDARIRPAANEMELHPHFQQPDLFKFVVDNQIQPIGFSPLGSPGRPERDRTSQDTSPLEDPVIVGIAHRRGVHPATICLRWAMGRGQVPIPFSVTPRNYATNLRACVEGPLTDEEMRAIADIDRDCRLIKGQVFLWKDGQSWEDLWDMNGEVTPA